MPPQLNVDVLEHEMPVDEAGGHEMEWCVVDLDGA